MGSRDPNKVWIGRKLVQTEMIFPS
jgi:hypothetical protein